MLLKSSPWVLISLAGLSLLQAQNAQSPFVEIPQASEPFRIKRSGPAVVGIEFHGVDRVPQSVLKAMIASRVGEAYDVETLQLDTRTLYQTKRFSHVTWEAEATPTGEMVVRFALVERPLIESIECRGGNAVKAAEILERFRQKKVDLRVDTLLDEEELPRAASAVRDLVAETGRRDFIVTPLVERLGPPSIVKITFVIADR